MSDVLICPSCERAQRTGQIGKLVGPPQWECTHCRDVFPRDLDAFAPDWKRRPPKTHDLKLAERWFADVVTGAKAFEVRYNDRDYRVGDTLFLRSWDPTRGCHTGSHTTMRVTYLLAGVDGLSEGYVVLGMEPEK